MMDERSQIQQKEQGTRDKVDFAKIYLQRGVQQDSPIFLCFSSLLLLSVFRVSCLFFSRASDTTWVEEVPSWVSIVAVDNTVFIFRRFEQEMFASS